MQKWDAISAGVNGGRAQTGDGSADRQTDGGRTGRQAERQRVKPSDRQMAGSQADRRVDRVRNGSRPIRKGLEA